MRLGTRSFIAHLFDLHSEQIIALFGQDLKVLEDAMKARKFLVVNHVLVDAGPDH